MPRMSGRTLAEGLTRARPGLRVLCVSGYSGEMLARHAGLDEGVTLLPKPFTPETLAAKVRDVLDRPPVSQPPSSPSPTAAGRVRARLRFGRAHRTEAV